MRLSQAATYFDKEIFTGIIETSITFSGQLRIFTDETSSGTSRGRRVLSVASDVTLPTDYLVKHAEGKRYIIGKHVDEDYWHGSVLRKKYTVTAITDEATTGSVGNVLSNALSTSLYSVIYPLSTFSERVDSSDKFNRVRIYFSASVSLPRDSIVYDGTHYYQIITNAFVDPAGFGFVDANTLEAPLTTADYVSTSNTYNPVTDSYSTSASSGLTIFQVPAIMDYSYKGLDSAKIAKGDLMVSVKKTDVAVANNGDTFDIDGIVYSVINIIDNTTYWSLLCRK